jgi:hypothetical protein
VAAWTVAIVEKEQTAGRGRVKEGRQARVTEDHAQAANKSKSDLSNQITLQGKCYSQKEPSTEKRRKEK